MNPLNIIAAVLRPLLYPLSFLYGIIMWVRNKLYDAKVLASVEFSVPVISVGNLSTGGTGKTPHIEYLINLLQYEYRLATMSRGYKRQSHGFLLADSDVDATAIGDEPMQFHLKFPELAVSVCEDRMTGIPQLLSERPETEVVLLDDAFQHRSVKPGLNILITDYQKPFYKDYILPFGGLRESRKAYGRADIIIVSKCPETLESASKDAIITHIRPLPHQQVFFTKISYRPLTDFFTGQRLNTAKDTYNILLVCGIARPEPLMSYLEKNGNSVHLLRYPDHHYFSDYNLEEIKSTFDNWDVGNKIIVTTEKDAVRLAMHHDLMRSWNVTIAVVPIKVAFLSDEAAFQEKIKTYIARSLPDYYNL